MLQRFSSLFLAPALALGLVGLEARHAPALAQSTTTEAVSAEVQALYDALALSDMVGIMREEGLIYGEEIAADMFGGAASAQALQDWNRTVAKIYDAPRMEAEIKATLARTLEGQDVAAMVAFFTSAPGTDFIRLEVTARRAFLDDEIESIAKEAAAVAIADQSPRYTLIRRFVEANDLVETNVVGAMNSNFAFYIGMMKGGALPVELTEQELLADVWSREEEIRANTLEWVYSFLLMAYEPLPEADIEAYIAFSETAPGRALNRAVFAAFDDMFENISMALGQASSVYMQGQEL
jgi:hypothetical protein